VTGSLSGRTVVVTRDEEPNGPLGAALASRGATVRYVRCVEALPAEDPGPMRRELARATDYDWLFLTSARAAHAIAGPLPGAWPRRVAAVGRGTAAALEAETGRAPDVVGSGGAEALVAEMGALSPLRGARILFPASDRSRPEGLHALRAAGAHVTQVVAYRILTREGARPVLRALLRDPAVHALTFTSPSAVAALGEAEGQEGSCRIAAIGGSTAAALEAAGWTDLVVAPRPGFDALAEALASALSPGKV
jgi:uroporphyrinogen-III synthase